MNSFKSLNHVPNELIQFQIMTFLGPKDLLPSLGSANKEYRTLATSDAVWTIFCKQRGNNSKVYEKVVELGKKNPGIQQTARYRSTIFRLKKSHVATTMDQYKILIPLHKRKWRYPRNTYCHWCMVQEFRDHPLELIKSCALCEKTACLDCTSIVGLLPPDKLRSCSRCERNCCHDGCAWKIVEQSHEDIQAVPLTSMKAYNETPDKDLVCTKCKKKEIAWRTKMSWEYEAFKL